jgi:beta-lactamase regulating signal transducer with metallopeptidase domain
MSLQFFAHLFTERMLGSLLGGMILALVAWIALRLIGRQNSRTRFAVWFATLLGIAALPFLGRWEAAAGVASAPLIRLPESWALYLLITWATAASYGLARTVVGLWQVRRLRRTCRAVDPQTLDVKLRDTLAEFSQTRPVTLCVSDAVRVPTAIGFGRPAVVLPSWCLQDLGSEDLHAIVLHELQHLWRRDDWTNLLQQVVGALFFFHPAVWWLEGRLALEREMACDDAVIAATSNRRAYARCLVSLAEKSYVRRGLAMAQAAVSRVQQMTARVTQILAADRPANTMSWKPAACIVGIVTVVGGASVSVAPQLVAFQTLAPVTVLARQDVLSVPPVNAALRDSTPHVPVVQAGWKEDPVKHASPKSAKLKVRKHAQAPRNTMAAIAPPAAMHGDAIQPVHDVQGENAPASELLLFVVHTQQEDASGMIWNVSYVRWVLYHPPVEHATTAGVPAKT